LGKDLLNVNVSLKNREKKVGKERLLKSGMKDGGDSVKIVFIYLLSLDRKKEKKTYCIKKAHGSRYKVKC